MTANEAVALHNGALNSGRLSLSLKYRAQLNVRVKQCCLLYRNTNDEAKKALQRYLRILIGERFNQGTLAEREGLVQLTSSC